VSPEGTRDDAGAAVVPSSALKTLGQADEAGLGGALSVRSLDPAAEVEAVAGDEGELSRGLSQGRERGGHVRGEAVDVHRFRTTETT
jgi:hypothetical protein